MAYYDVFGHTDPKRMFNKDVYGIGYNEERSSFRKIKLGIIGVGGVAQSKYLPAINRLRTLWEPVEVTAYATRNRAQLEKVQSIYGGSAYTDYRDMLNNEELDGVLVCSANDVHMEHVLACLEKRLGVMVEKPISCSLKEAKLMCDAAQKHNCLLMTVANKRYSPPYYRARQAVLEGAVQNPAMMSGKFNLGYDYVDILEGGTVHLFDITRYLMGDVKTITATATRKYDFNQTGYPFDNGVSILEFDSGAVGTVYTSASALSLKPWERVEVYAKKAWLSVEDQQKLIIYDEEEGPTKSFEPVFPNTLLFDEEFGGFAPMIKDFADCLRDGSIPMVTGVDGLKAYELVAAFHISVMTGEKVKLPLDNDYADSLISKIFSK